MFVSPDSNSFRATEMLRHFDVVDVWGRRALAYDLRRFIHGGPDPTSSNST